MLSIQQVFILSLLMMTMEGVGTFFFSYDSPQPSPYLVSLTPEKNQ